ncbi:hypothetical protein lerEdw1_019785 [Lerista edwardsae]|nr:hypothetical protein lerEdw1_019785 [Lerista edwardsae]
MHVNNNSDEMSKDENVLSPGNRRGNYWLKRKKLSQNHSHFSITGDATYLDIFREFSHMASNNPEKLNRRSLYFSHSYR